MGQKLPPSICTFGAEYMFKQALELENELGDALTGQDIEAIHNMRVASRRLRNGINLFGDCFPTKKKKMWNSEIRKITRSLSNARDLDIQIKYINQVYENSLETTYKPGYRRLLLRMKQRRIKAQEKANKTLNKFHEGDLLQQMRNQIKKVNLDEKDLTTNSSILFMHAYKAIDSTLEDFLSFQPYLHSSKNTKKLHAMRIAGKHLRYTLEIYAPIYDHALNPFISVMKEIQDELGDFHDNDVWVNWLPKFIKKEEARIEDYFGNTGPLDRLLPGLQHLIEDRTNAREKAYQSFHNTWEILEGENAWDTMRKILTESCHDHPLAEGAIPTPKKDPSQLTEIQDNEHEEFEVELTPGSLNEFQDKTEPTNDPYRETQGE